MNYLNSQDSIILSSITINWKKDELSLRLATEDTTREHNKDRVRDLDFRI